MLATEPELSRPLLRRLLAGELLAARIPGYCRPAECSYLTDQVLAHLRKAPDAPRRIYSSTVRAYTEVAADPGRRGDYLANAVAALRTTRQLCRPVPPPPDRLRCELDELWPGGASLLRVGNEPLVFGMARVWDGGAEALQHLDVSGAAAPDIAEAHGFIEQLGVNIHLSTAGAEGEGAIDVWDLGLSDLDPGAHRPTGTYGFQRSLLPPPALVIAPRAGDLVLLRTTRLHAVRATRRGVRVTFSGFVGHAGPERPLRMWS